MIATDGNATYVLFLYEDIQWPETFGPTVIIGFSAGDAVRFFNLPEASSFTTIRTLPLTSNVEIPGTYIFRVDQEQIISEF